MLFRSPDTIQLYGDGVPLPGQTIQTQSTETGAVATGTTQVPNDDTIPQNTEGDQYMSQAITPTSAANVLIVETQAMLAVSSNFRIVGALFQDSTANALAAAATSGSGFSSAGGPWMARIRKAVLAATTSATTLKFRAGPDGAATVTFNGEGGARRYGGVNCSFIRIDELMA